MVCEMDRDEFDKLLHQRLAQLKEDQEPQKRTKQNFTVGRMTKEGWSSERDP